MAGEVINEAEFGDNFRKAIKNIMREALLIDGIITNTDDAESKFVCDVTVGDSINSVIYTNVQIKVLINSQASVIEIPQLNSNCTLMFRDANLGRPQIIMIDKVLKYLVNCTNVIFNGGNKGGLIDVVDLVTQINTLQKDVNILKTAFTTWAPVADDGGAALKAAAAEWSGEQLELTVRADIEDTSITH